MTTPQPAALPELPEKLIFSERLAISEAAQVPMDAECCRVIQATLDYISSNYALAALQPAAAVSDEEIIAIKKATKAADPTQPWGDTLAFARAILALRPQAVPMTDEQFTQLLRKLKRSREVFQAGRDSYETACAPMNSDDEAWFAYLAHHGITQRADGGGKQA